MLARSPRCVNLLSCTCKLRKIRLMPDFDCLAWIDFGVGPHGVKHTL